MRTNSLTKRLIPKSTWWVLLDNERQLRSYCQENSNIEDVFYQFFRFYLVTCGITPQFLLCMKEIWSSNKNMERIFSYCSFVWRLSSIHTKESCCFNSTMILIVLYAVISIFNSILSYLYFSKGRISYTSCYFANLVEDILMPILILWGFSQIATDLSLFFNGSPGTSSNVLPLIILVIFVLIFSAFYLTIILPQLAFSIVRTLTWDPLSELWLFVIISTNLFLTRLVELSPHGWPGYIISIVGLIGLFVSAFFLTYFRPFILIRNNAFILAGSYSGTLIYILNIIRFHLYDMHGGMLVFLIATILYLFFAILLYFYMKKIEAKAVHELSEMTNDSDSFFKSKRTFLFYARIGFSHGVPLILDWEPFKKAIKLWPNSMIVWIYYIRFLSIFHAQTEELVVVAQQFKKKHFKSLIGKTFLYQTHRVIDSRKKHMSSLIKRSITPIDDQIKSLKSQLVTYWRAMEAGAPTSSYDLASDIWDRMQKIESDYSHLVLFYPNVASISAHYSNYLHQIVCDPFNASLWKRRQQYLKNDHIAIDTTQQSGFIMFPRLHIRPLDSTQKELMLFTSPDDLTGESGVGSRRNSSTNNDSTQNDTTPTSVEPDDDNEMYISQIRSMGLHAPVQFVNTPIIWIVVNFVLVFIAGFLFNGIYINIGSSTCENYFQGVVSICNFSATSLRVANLMLIDSMTRSGLFPKHEDQDINPEEVVFSQIIPDLTTSLSLHLSNMDNLFGSEIPADTDSGIEILTGHAKIMYHTTTPTSINYTITYREATTALIGYLYQYSLLNENNLFFNKPWLTMSVENSVELYLHFQEIASLLNDDIDSSISKDFNIILIVSIVFIVASIVIIPIFICLVVNIRQRYKSMISSFTTFPYSVTRGTIKHFLPEEEAIEDPWNCIDSKYASIFTQLSAMQHGKKGIPVSILIFLTVLLFITGFIGYIVFIFYFPGQIRKFSTISSHYVQNFQALDSLFYGSLAVLRQLAFDQSQPFFMDTQDDISERFSICHPNDVLDELAKFMEYDIEVVPKSGSIVETFANIPIFQIIDITANTFRHIRTRVVKNNELLYDPIEGYDKIALTYIYTVVNHIPQFFSMQLSDEFIKAMDDVRSGVLRDIIICEVVFLLVGLVITVIIVDQLLSVKSVIRFTLSSLSMLDYKKIKDTEDFIGLFSDRYNAGEKKIKPTIHNALEEVKDVVNEALFIVSTSNRIIDCNMTAMKQFGIGQDNINDMNTELLFTFDDPSVINTMKSLASPVTMTTNITSVKLGNTWEAKVSMFPFEESIALLFSMPGDEQKLALELEKIQATINRLEMSLIPANLRDVLQYQEGKKSIVLSAKKVIYGFIGVTEIKNKTAMKMAYSTLEKAVSNAMNGLIGEDVSIMRRFNFYYPVVFNLKGKYPKQYQSVFAAMSFMKAVASFAQDQNVLVKASLTFDKTTTAGLIQSTWRMHFDVFSSTLQEAYELAQIATPATMMVVGKIYKHLPSEFTNGVTSSYIQMMSNQKQMIYSLPIQKFEVEPVYEDEKEPETQRMLLDLPEECISGRATEEEKPSSVRRQKKSKPEEIPHQEIIQPEEEQALPQTNELSTKEEADQPAMHNHQVEATLPEEQQSYEEIEEY